MLKFVSKKHLNSAFGGKIPMRGYMVDNIGSTESYIDYRSDTVTRPS